MKCTIASVTLIAQAPPKAYYNNDHNAVPKGAIPEGPAGG